MGKRTKDQQSERSQAAIIEATIGLIAKHGFAGTTIDRIAEAANISRGSIFWHFNTKEGLFRAVVDSIRGDFEKHVLADALEQKTARKKLERLLSNYARMIELDCSRCLDLTVLIIETVQSNEEFAQVLRNLFAGWAQVLVDILEQGKTDGLVRSDIDTKTLAYSIIGCLEGLTVQFHLNRGTLKYSNLMRTFRSVFFDGLLRT